MNVADPVLLENAHLITMDRDRRVIPCGHLLVRDGRIAAVGAGPYTGDRGGLPVRDMGGQVILPGLVNAHHHSYGNLLKGHMERTPLEVYVLHVIVEGPRTGLGDVEAAAALGALELLTSGCTAFLDHLSQGPEGLAAAAGVYRRLGIRSMLTPQVSDKPYADTLPRGFAVPPVAAGSLSGSRSAGAAELLAWLAEVVRTCHRPEEGITVAMGPSGPQRCSDELLLGTADLARRHGLQWHTHLLESRVQEVTAAEQYGRSMVDHIAGLGLLGPRASVAHAIWTSAADLDRLAAAGTSVVHVPVANLQVGDGIMPFAEMRRRGITVALGTDSSGCTGCQSMFEVMKLAALLGRVIEPDAQQWPTALDALEAATLGGARALGLADQIGSIEVGKSADLVFLRRDAAALTPLHNAIWQVVFGRPEGAVAEVWVKGRPVVAGGRVLGMDHDAILAEAAERGRHLMAQCEDAHAQVRAEAPAFTEMVVQAWQRPSQALARRWHK